MCKMTAKTMKYREEPTDLYQLQALERRVHDGNLKKEIIVSDLRRKVTEINGLTAVDFPLKFIDDNTLILHNIRLSDENGFFQMDVLLLVQKCIVILEIKNWYGTILFSEHGQVIRLNKQNKEEGFPNPILQAKLQQYRLRKWLRNKGLSDISI